MTEVNTGTQVVQCCEYCNKPLAHPIYPDQRFCRGSETNCRKLRYQQRKRQRDKIDKTTRQTIMETGDTHLQQQQQIEPIILKAPERELVRIITTRRHPAKRGASVITAEFRQQDGDVANEDIETDSELVAYVLPFANLLQAGLRPDVVREQASRHLRALEASARGQADKVFTSELEDLFLQLNLIEVAN